MSEEYSIKDFYKLAVEKFGNKFLLGPIEVTKDILEKWNSENNTDLSMDDVSEYREVWLIEDKCPSCNSELLGLFGSFQWGFVNGQGYCSECNKVTLKYYHRIGEPKVLLCGFSLIGF